MAIEVRDSVDPSRMGLSVYRYLTIEKFKDLLERGAMWFSNLDQLRDQYEGTLPELLRKKAIERDQELKALFSQSFASQFDNMTDRGIASGRRVVSVNCWHLNEEECPRMWQEYTEGRGVAIRTSLLGLSQAFDKAGPDLNFPFMGAVEYVDFETEQGMPFWKRTDAGHRAFLKDRRGYAHEREIRVVTLNLMQQPKGLHVPCRLRSLMQEVIVAPGAQLPFIAGIAGWLARRELHIPVFPSRLSPTPGLTADTKRVQSGRPE